MCVFRFRDLTFNWPSFPSDFLQIGLRLWSKTEYWLLSDQEIRRSVFYLHFILLYFTALHYTEQYCNVLYCTVLHYTTLNCSAKHYQHKCQFQCVPGLILEHHLGTKCATRCSKRPTQTPWDSLFEMMGI